MARNPINDTANLKLFEKNDSTKGKPFVIKWSHHHAMHHPSVRKSSADSPPIAVCLL
jgi:hypothetical protein